MPVLTLKNAKSHWADPVEIDTADLLAVHFYGYHQLTDGSYAHRRQIYTKDRLVTVWETSKSKDVPPSIALLDNLGGKAFTTAARVASYRSSNSSELAGACPISISTEDADFVTKRMSSDRKLARTGVGGAFTNSAKPETVADSTRIYYAMLNIAGKDVPVAHLNPAKFNAFGGE